MSTLELVSKKIELAFIGVRAVIDFASKKAYILFDRIRSPSKIVGDMFTVSARCM